MHSRFPSRKNNDPWHGMWDELPPGAGVQGPNRNFHLIGSSVRRLDQSIVCGEKGGRRREVHRRVRGTRWVSLE
jgi:hypothetical protein